MSTKLWTIKECWRRGFSPEETAGRIPVATPIANIVAEFKSLDMEMDEFFNQQENEHEN